MAVSVIRRIHVPCRTTHRHKDLVIRSPSASQQGPVKRAGGHIKGTGVDQHEGAFPGRDHSRLGKANVVADGQPDFAVLREIDDGQLVPRGEDVALLELDLARDVDVEEMRLAVGADQGAGGGEDQRGIVVFVRRGLEFGDTPADEVGFGVGGDAG